MASRAIRLKQAVFLAGTAWLFCSLARRQQAGTDVEPAEAAAPVAASPPLGAERGSAVPRHVAWLFVAIILFGVGAALGGAFAASAEEGLPPGTLSGATATDGTVSSTAETAATTEPQGEEAVDPPVAVEEPTAPEPQEEPASDGGATPSQEPAAEPSAGESAADPPEAASQHAGGPVLAPHTHSKPAGPETGEGGAATIWLHRVLPDPTPPARRLSPEFAARIRGTALVYGIRWPLMLAVLRAQGHAGRVPATQARLDRLAANLAARRVRLTPTIRALATYNRAVGLHALVVGLEAARPQLARRTLLDRKIDIYPGGRADIEAGRIDVRVLVTIRYLAKRFGQVTVSSLVTGHRLFARPGVVSAHVYGLAVDVAALRDTSILGHQERGGLTERAVEALLRLPAEVQPQQIISLLGVGGASFPAADHYDHIHVGF